MAADGRVLLLRGPDREGRPHWFTIGGGVEGDETVPEAACRELREETGLHVLPEDLGDPIYVGPYEYVSDGMMCHDEATIFLVLVDPELPVSFERAGAGEVILDAAWAAPDRFEFASGGTVPPLAVLLERAVQQARH